MRCPWERQHDKPVMFLLGSRSSRVPNRLVDHFSWTFAACWCRPLPTRGFKVVAEVPSGGVMMLFWVMYCLIVTLHLKEYGIWHCFFFGGVEGGEVLQNNSRSTLSARSTGISGDLKWLSCIVPSEIDSAAVPCHHMWWVSTDQARLELCNVFLGFVHLALTCAKGASRHSILFVPFADKWWVFIALFWVWLTIGIPCAFACFCKLISTWAFSICFMNEQFIKKTRYIHHHNMMKL